MKIVQSEFINEIEIEKSKFITYIKRVDSIDEANEYLALIKKKHYDATHHCVALIIGDTCRSQDNGEPSGTAGVPMLEVLKKNDITNTICIVVRYFGGIKLGAGGLVRAYSSSVSEVLKISKFVTPKVFKKYEVIIDYPVYNSLLNTLKDSIVDSYFTHNVTLQILVSDEKVLDKIKDISLGNAIIKYLNDEIKDVEI